MTSAARSPAAWAGWVALLGGGRLALSTGSADDVSSASAHGCTVVLDGALTNGAQLDAVASDDAGAVIAAYLRDGEKALSRLRGSFCLLLWDERNATCHCMRDRLGTYPLYRTRVGSNDYFSTSIEALLRVDGVSSELDCLAVAKRLARVPLERQETFYRAVRCVPPGSVLVLRGGTTRLSRYWLPERGGLESLTPAAAVERFEGLVTAAARRCSGADETAIMLSGGADSITVAVAASASSGARQGPLALSIVFPVPAGNEETTQTRVATALGLRQVLRPLEEMTRPDGPFLAAIAQNAAYSLPALSFWRPVFSELAAEGRRCGCTTIVTGEGGDEWLQPSPGYAADRLGHLDLPALARLSTAWSRYYSYSRASALRDVAWVAGGRPLLRSLLSGPFELTAPEHLRRVRERRAEDSLPTWFAPDASLRRGVIERMAGSPIPSPGRFLEHDLATALDRSWFSLTLESYFEMGRRVGVRIRHPLLDDDLLDFLIALPAEVLLLESRAKGVARAYVLRRLPGLGPTWPLKGNTRPYGLRVIERDGRRALAALRGPQALAELGVVSGKHFLAAASRTLDRGDLTHAEDVWEVLSLEAWVRARC